MGILVHALFLILLVMFVAIIYYYFRLVKYLEVKHPSVWQKLNKPTWIPSTAPEDKLLMKNFEEKDEYLSLDDPELTSMVNIRKKIQFYAKLLLCLYVGAFLAFIVKSSSVHAPGH